MLHHRLLMSLVIMVLAMGCKPQPEDIHYGEDQCAFCKMNIADPKFGGELVTDKGRVYKFDAVECMIHFQEGHDEKFFYTLVTPYERPGTLMNSDSVVFVISDTIKSPMGANLAALVKGPAQPGNGLSWEEMKKEISH